MKGIFQKGLGAAAPKAPPFNEGHISKGAWGCAPKAPPFNGKVYRCNIKKIM
jgi:hypothetical protein